MAHSRWGRMLVAVVVAAWTLPAAAWAQNGSKIGFVDVRKVLFSSREGKTVQQQIQKLEEQKLDTLRPLRDELERLEKELEKQKFLITEEALAERQLEIIKRRRNLERDFRAAEEEVQLESLRMMQPVKKKIADALEKIGKDKGFTMIVDKSTQGLLYADTSLEVTELVIQHLNGS